MFWWILAGLIVIMVVLTYINKEQEQSTCQYDTEHKKYTYMMPKRRW